MKYWLVKSEPGVYSIDDLRRDKKTEWDGVRNFQARNFMRDEMMPGDHAIFYHSNADPSGAAGVARVLKKGYPDPSDPKTPEEKPQWYRVDVGFVEKFKRTVSLEEIKNHPGLKGIMVARRGSRLSVQPVDKIHFDLIRTLGGKA